MIGAFDRSRQIRVPITMTEDERRAGRKGPQCAAVFVRGRGRSISFCVGGQGHEGDHRGYRVQWREESLP